VPARSVIFLYRNVFFFYGSSEAWYLSRGHVPKAALDFKAPPPPKKTFHHANAHAKPSEACSDGRGVMPHTTSPADLVQTLREFLKAGDCFEDPTNSSVFQLIRYESLAREIGEKSTLQSPSQWLLSTSQSCSYSRYFKCGVFWKSYLGA
jgi:hypothetical protein